MWSRCSGSGSRIDYGLLTREPVPRGAGRHRHRRHRASATFLARRRHRGHGTDRRDRRAHGALLGPDRGDRLSGLLALLRPPIMRAIGAAGVSVVLVAAGRRPHATSRRCARSARRSAWSNPVGAADGAPTEASSPGSLAVVQSAADSSSSSITLAGLDGPGLACHLDEADVHSGIGLLPVSSPVRTFFATLEERLPCPRGPPRVTS